MHGATLPFSHMPSWHVEGQLYRLGCHGLLKRQQQSTFRNLYIYIYIYMCVCVCVKSIRFLRCCGSNNLCTLSSVWRNFMNYSNCLVPAVPWVCLWAGRSGDRIPVGATFYPPVQTGPGAYPASYTMGTGSFPGVRRPEHGVDHPLPYSAEVKDRVYLCLYSPYGPSWPVLGWTLPLPWISSDYFYVTWNRSSSGEVVPMEIKKCLWLHFLPRKDRSAVSYWHHRAVCKSARVLACMCVAYLYFVRPF
jgi:hypothetical protein